MDSVGGEAWHNGVAVWKVTYEYADLDGGGERVDYFKTANRRTPPTGAGIEESLNSEEVTVLGVEGIEFFWTDTPDDPDSPKPPLDDAAHKRLFDLTNDMRGAGSRLEVRE